MGSWGCHRDVMGELGVTAVAYSLLFIVRMEKKETLYGRKYHVQGLFLYVRTGTFRHLSENWHARSRYLPIV